MAPEPTFTPFQRRWVKRWVFSYWVIFSSSADLWLNENQRLIQSYTTAISRLKSSVKTWKRGAGQVQIELHRRREVHEYFFDFRENCDFWQIATPQTGESSKTPFPTVVPFFENHLPKTYFPKGKCGFPRGNSVALTKNLFFQGGELLANGWLAGLAGWYIRW